MDIILANRKGINYPVKMMKLTLITACVVACTSPFVAGFSNVGPVTFNRSASKSLNMAKGFGEEKKPREKSAAAVKRESESSKYDELANSGGQQYSIFVRQFGGQDDSWFPCGAIAVPRGAQVSDALFANEQALKEAIVRTYPKLKGFEQEFEFGCNLKLYPDDPVEVVSKKGAASSGPSIGNWISNLLSPIDASKVPPPPMD